MNLAGALVQESFSAGKENIKLAIKLSPVPTLLSCLLTIFEKMHQASRKNKQARCNISR